MRRAMFVFATALVVASVSIGVFGLNVAVGQTEIHVVTLTANHSFITVDSEKDGFGAGDRIVAWEPLFAEDRVTRVGRASWDCVGIKGESDRAKRVMCVGLWELAGGQITLRYVQALPTDGIFADFTFAVTGGTGTYANAGGEGTFTGFEEYGDFVVTLEG